MPAFEPGKIRNVAVVGHRGTGKTSLVEALLFQAGETNRLGTIDAGSTVADWDDDEQQRKMSIALSLETRVLAACDVYDALRSDRVYREAWCHERAMALLREEAGTKFDARCVEALSRVLDRQPSARTLVAV